MQASHNGHIHIVGIHKQTNQIIAFGSVIVVNTALDGRVGKIENIVTAKTMRGKGLGRVIIEVLKDEGWKAGCSKITLFCEDHNVKFYEKLGFKLKGEIFACYK
jgi:glucosamine-phosphate N-acetyltransferase